MPTNDPQNNRPHVLVVEDDELMRDVAREYLEESGFFMSEVENGIEALDAVKDSIPDIILLDVMMPEMDGFTACSHIRKTSGCELIPILMLTALDDIISINRAYSVGATDFITKPINWVILVQRVRYMIRTMRIMNERKRLENELQRAQKLEAIATLAGGIAHDFNNLLQTIQGFAELLLLKTGKNGFGQKELQQIYAAARRGGELTLQLLTYSRKMKSDRQPINLNHRVRSVQNLLQRIIPKMIDIELRLDRGLVTVNADAGQVDQVLMNLAVNSKDAMPEGGKLIIQTSNVTLSKKFCERQPKAVPGDYVMLRVSDTGHGMDRKTLAQIFEPFFSTKALGKGSGLGLSMVYGIVENHLGFVTCDSAPGKGTTFKVYFPTSQTDQSISAAPVQTAEHIRGGNETIMVVDDEDSIRDYNKICLENEGYTVLKAVDGESALTLYSENMPEIDLVLLDIIMPGISGKKCLQELLALDPDAKVLILSGHSPENRFNEYIALGAKGYLRKPYERNKLLEMVRKTLDQV